MNVLRQVASELYSMFAGDAVMSVITIAVVAVATLVHILTPIPPAFVGFGLLAMCLVLLVARVFSYGYKVSTKGNPKSL